MWSLFPAVWEAVEVLGISGVLAHQGGWDEILMALVPVALFGGLVWLAIARSHHDGNGSPDRPGAP
jgi:hypothetical protein